MRCARSLFLVLALVFSNRAALAGPGELPVHLVSPAGGGAIEVPSSCPTFSWSEVPGAQGYVLAVYAVEGQAGEGVRPPLEINLPSGSSSFTPTAGQCLGPGRRYGWAVGALLPEAVRWSEPAIFRVSLATVAGPDPGPSARLQDAGPSAAPDLGFSPAAAAGRAPTVEEAFAPPACVAGAEIFADVPASHPLCPFIEQLFRDQVATACAVSPLRYCPKSPVTRAEIAALLERAMRGTNTFRPMGTGGQVANFPPAPTTRTGLDTAGNVGRQSSVTIGADGLGLISYHDSNLDLKVAHCSNVFCTPHFRRR